MRRNQKKYHYPTLLAILYLVQKSIKNKQSPEGFALHQLLMLWESKEGLDKQVTFLEYAKTWVNHVNHGGLLLISDMFCMFV